MEGLRKDDRVQKLKRLNKNKKPINMGMFYPDKDNKFYEGPKRNIDEILDARDLENKKITGFSLNDTRFDPRTDARQEPGFETHNKYDSQFRVGPDPRNNNIMSDLKSKDKSYQYGNNFSQYDNKKKDYMLMNEYDRSALYRGKRYGELANPTFSEKSDMDYENKMVIPNVATKSKKNLNTANYRRMPFITETHDLKDVDLESSYD